jgi:hypothetical protein
MIIEFKSFFCRYKSHKFYGNYKIIRAANSKTGFLYMDMWEYKVIKFETKGWFTGVKLDTSIYDVELNILGDEGWELVTCFDLESFGSGPRYIVATFKRKKVKK